MNTAVKDQVCALLRSQRWAALATMRNDVPYASMVAFVAAPDFSCLYLHLSRLASHTRNLLKNPRVTLVISEQDNGTGDPQTLARLSIQGRLEPFAPDHAGYQEARALYIARLPASEGLFDFSDFMLLRLIPERLRYVGGFARAYDLSPQDLLATESSSQT